MMGLIGQVWTRGIPVELTGTNSPKAYIIFFEVCWLVCWCLRPLYGFEITALIGCLKARGSRVKTLEPLAFFVSI